MERYSHGRYTVGYGTDSEATTSILTCPDWLDLGCPLIAANDRYANNPDEADHSRLKARIWSMRGLKRLRSTRVIGAGHAFVQNIRRGHYELGTDVDPEYRLAAAFDELARAI